MKEAVRWYRASAEQGNPLGQSKLGIAFLLGEGVTADPVRSFMWLSLAGDSDMVDVSKPIALLREQLTAEQLVEGEELVVSWRERRASAGGTASP